MHRYARIRTSIPTMCVEIRALYRQNTSRIRRRSTSDILFNMKSILNYRNTASDGFNDLHVVLVNADYMDVQSGTFEENSMSTNRFELNVQCIRKKKQMSTQRAYTYVLMCYTISIGA